MRACTHVRLLKTQDARPKTHGHQVFDFQRCFFFIYRRMTVCLRGKRPKGQRKVGKGKKGNRVIGFWNQKANHRDTGTQREEEGYWFLGTEKEGKRKKGKKGKQGYWFLVLGCWKLRNQTNKQNKWKTKKRKMGKKRA